MTTRAGSASAATRTEAPSGRARPLGSPRPGKSGLPPARKGDTSPACGTSSRACLPPSAEGGVLALRRARGWGTSETVPVKMGARSQARGGKPRFRAPECVRCCFRLLAALPLRCSCLRARLGALRQDPFGEGAGGGGSGSSRSATQGKWGIHKARFALRRHVTRSAVQGRWGIHKGSRHLPSDTTLCKRYSA